MIVWTRSYHQRFDIDQYWYLDCFFLSKESFLLKKMLEFFLSNNNDKKKRFGLVNAKMLTINLLSRELSVYRNISHSKTHNLFWEHRNAQKFDQNRYLFWIWCRKIKLIFKIFYWPNHISRVEICNWPVCESKYNVCNYCQKDFTLIFWCVQDHEELNKMSKLFKLLTKMETKSI